MTELLGDLRKLFRSHRSSGGIQSLENQSHMERNKVSGML